MLSGPTSTSTTVKNAQHSQHAPYQRPPTVERITQKYLKSVNISKFDTCSNQPTYLPYNHSICLRFRSTTFFMLYPFPPRITLSDELNSLTWPFLPRIETMAHQPQAHLPTPTRSFFDISPTD